ncbi:hypothetical protein N7491_011121 [Penicillium cf. griseofulvum]|nr:hypothetical protein N7491_011121 [Penicillium cf. griseofulvum]
MTWGGSVPGFLHWNALHYNSNAGEKRDRSSDSKTSPDKPDLNFIPHNSKKEHPNSCFTHANGHDSSYLAK